MAKASKAEKGLAKRVSNLEREVKGLTREVPMPASQRLSAAARAADVAQDLARLQGRSRSDLVGDRDRGASSPIGHGTGSRGRRK